MVLVTRPPMSDDDGTFTSGTDVDKAFIDALLDEVDAQTHSAANPTVKPNTITDEVVAARGSKASLDDRLDIALNEDGTLKSQSSLVSVTTAGTFVGARNVANNGDLDDWASGAAAAPDDWTLSGAGATIARTGPGEADTFSFNTGQNGYAAKITRVGNNAKLTQIVIATADFSKFANCKSQKVSFTAKVKTSIASHARIIVDDGATTTASSYHTGGGSEEHLSVTHTISNTATKLEVYVSVESNNGSVYFGGITVVFSDIAPSDWSPLSAVPLATATRRGLVSTGAQTWAGAKTFNTQPTTYPGTQTTNQATVGGVWSSQNGSAGNVNAAETDMMSVTVKGNTMSADNKVTVIRAAGTLANNGNTKTIRFYYGGTLVATAAAATAFADGGWRAEIRIHRTGGATQWIDGYIYQIGGGVMQLNGQFSVTGAKDNTADQIAKFTGQSSAASSNDIVQKTMTVAAEN